MHYYSKDQDSEFKKRELNTTIRGFDLKFIVSNGVFSSRKIDYGTQFLAENMELKKGMKVLDLGCGYGVLGVVAGMMGCDVVLSDVNKRACFLADLNLKMNGVKGKVIVSNVYDFINGKFDVILCNPPHTAGKEVCFMMIDQAKERIKSNGVFYLVARHNKGGKSLSERMMKKLGNVKEVKKSRGYRIYLSKVL